MRSGPDISKLAAKRVLRTSFQRELAHVPIVAPVQGTRSTRPNIRQQAQPQRRGCSPLRTLESICPELVHSRPSRASSGPSCAEHDGLLLRSQFLVQSHSLHRFSSGLNPR